MSLDPGIQRALSKPVPNPLPSSWLGRADAPPQAPKWSSIGAISDKQMRGLVAQIGYDASAWDYKKIGPNNQLGRYQISTQMLEAYGLLSKLSTKNYGTSCVNYQHCWKPTYTASAGDKTTFQNYFFNTTSLTSFLSTGVAQEYLAYQRLVDLYLGAKKNRTILETDTPDTVAGMMYVCWTLGVGQSSNDPHNTGTGAWAWRYHAVGLGIDSFNGGRYAIANLSN